jgi:hypothetical protein
VFLVFQQGLYHLELQVILEILVFQVIQVFQAVLSHLEHHLFQVDLEFLVLLFVH